jgi:hypothetical protein
LATLRLLGGAAISLAKDVFNCVAACILNDESIEIEGVDLEELLPQHFHNFTMAAHPLHRLFLK